MGIVTTIAPIALALIMLGLGASLTVKDFTRVFQNPKDLYTLFVFKIELNVNMQVLSKIRQR